MRPRSSRTLVAVLLALAISAGAARAADVVDTDNGIAIKGYDPVAYFTNGKPVKGSPAHEMTYHGATYEFASARHRRLFAAHPAKYVPRFGGFCAFGVAGGHKADIDPAAFSIVGGRLYLNRNMKVRDLWDHDIPGYIRKADAAWPKVSRDPNVIR